jgi:hypothetical protein
MEANATKLIQDPNLAERLNDVVSSPELNSLMRDLFESFDRFRSVIR